MEKLKGAKIVRLMSQLTKEYLKSNSSKGGVELDYMSAERDMCWFVELLDNNPEVVALKNYHTGNYLAATADGTQLILSDGLAEWIPLKVGSSHIKLKTRDGNFLQVDHYPHPRGPILTTVDNNFTALWAVDVIRQADCYSSLPTRPSSFGGSGVFSVVDEGTSHIPIQMLRSGPVKCNRWNIFALVIKAIAKLRLMLREAYEIQEKMKLHCCLFPNDYEFERDTLVQLWMAAGYLKDDRMEEYGRRYFDILLNKKLILFSRIDTSSGECKYVTNVPNGNLQSEDADIFTILKDELMGAQEGLETLDLSGSHITELPGSIGNVRQLRYLNISFTLIESLPESISRLQELQTLNLEGCKQLYALPKRFNKLNNLRHLYFDVLGQLSFMPRGMGDLTQLRTLSAFIVDDGNDCNVRELARLNNLTGSCCISGLLGVMFNTPGESVLSNKVHLTKLQLRWNENMQICGEFDSDVSYLVPHSCLEELQLLYYPYRKLPEWICEDKYKQLNSITLRKCKINKLHICLGRLPNLKCLYLIQMNSIDIIDHGDYLRHASFPRLEKLTIDGMSCLTHWTDVESWDFPLLSEFSIKNCPKIGELYFLPFLNSLKVLEIVNCLKLRSLSHLKLNLPEKLETLTVDDCPLLNEKYFFGQGAQWDKINHVPHICFDLQDLHSLSNDAEFSHLIKDEDADACFVSQAPDIEPLQGNVSRRLERELYHHMGDEHFDTQLEELDYRKLHGKVLHLYKVYQARVLATPGRS